MNSRTDNASHSADGPQRSSAPGEIRLLVDSFYAIQNLRIQQGNRIHMLVRDYGVDESEASMLHNMIKVGLTSVERDIEKRVRHYVRPMPIYKLWMGPEVKGVAEILAGGIIAGLGDIGKFGTVSKVWKYCGLGINEDGGIQKRKRGEKINYSPFLKTLCWKIGESFVKISDRGYYGERLSEYKNNEVKKQLASGIVILPQADIPKKDDGKVYMSQGHVHNRAKRKAVKLFLSHTWHVWREIEGLPTEGKWFPPEGHHYYDPPGWDSLLSNEAHRTLAAD